MSILKWLFGKKNKTEKNKEIKSTSYGGGYASTQSNYIGDTQTSYQNEMLNPLNPLSPLWFGNTDNYSSPSTDISSHNSWDSGSSHHHSDTSSFDSSSSWTPDTTSSNDSSWSDSSSSSSSFGDW